MADKDANPQGKKVIATKMEELEWLLEQKWIDGPAGVAPHRSGAWVEGLDADHKQHAYDPKDKDDT